MRKANLKRWIEVGWLALTLSGCSSSDGSTTQEPFNGGGNSGSGGGSPGTGGGSGSGAVSGMGGGVPGGTGGKAGSSGVGGGAGASGTSGVGGSAGASGAAGSGQTDMCISEVMKSGSTQKCSECLCTKCPQQLVDCYPLDNPQRFQLCKAVIDCCTRLNLTGDACYFGGCQREIDAAAGGTAATGACQMPGNACYAATQFGICNTQFKCCP